jgi:uncharacterized protein YqgV (UPF0045/DUF77 family)
MAIAELSIVPIGTESTSLSSYVAACVEVLTMKFMEWALSSRGN